MAHRGSRFFDGYQVEYDGQGKKSLRYTAEWYGFSQPGQQRRLKWVVSGLILGMLACYFAAQFFPSPGGMARYMAVPSLLSLVPMIFLLMGWVNFLLAKQHWELRVYYAGYRRLTRASWCQLALLALWWAAECFYMVTHWAEIAGELGYFCCITLSTAAVTALVILLRKHPAQVVRGPEIR